MPYESSELLLSTVVAWAKEKKNDFLTWNIVLNNFILLSLWYCGISFRGTHLCNFGKCNIDFVLNQFNSFMENIEFKRAVSESDACWIQANVFVCACVCIIPLCLWCRFFLRFVMFCSLFVLLCAQKFDTPQVDRNKPKCILKPKITNAVKKRIVLF